MGILFQKIPKEFATNGFVTFSDAWEVRQEGEGFLGGPDCLFIPVRGKSSESKRISLRLCGNHPTLLRGGTNK